MSAALKRFVLAVAIVLAAGMLRFAPVAKAAPAAGGSCQCDDFTFDPPCPTGEWAASGTLECDEDGDGFVCSNGEWVECHESGYDDMFCNDAPNDESCQYWEEIS